MHVYIYSYTNDIQRPSGPFFVSQEDVERAATENYQGMYIDTLIDNDLPELS